MQALVRSNMHMQHQLCKVWAQDITSLLQRYTSWHLAKSNAYCAGRAAEELVYGQDEMSTINQRRIVMARRIVQKLTVASAMVDNPDIGPRTISTPMRRGGKSLKQIVTNRVRPTAVSAVIQSGTGCAAV